MRFLKAGSILLLWLLFTHASALHLPAIFSDHMVLQQKSAAAFWGTAAANERIKISATWGSEVQTLADAHGKWQVNIKTPTAGGPYTVSVAGEKETRAFQDVLIGEVWLCSGQSNMQMPLQGWPPNDLIESSEQVIAQANIPDLRLFYVTRAVSHVPLADCEGRWSPCTPETAKEFSATAFFFGRKLHADLGIPIGLIHSSWGGTPVQAWTSDEFLATIPEYQPIIDNIHKSAASINEYQAWQKQHVRVSLAGKAVETMWQDLEFDDQECSREEYADEAWPTMTLPQQWENSELGVFDGAVWFRKTVDLPADWSGHDGELELGPIDDMDRTFVNGVLVGQHEQDGFWNVERKYLVPGRLLKPGKNSIAVRVLDNQGGGGIFGTPEQMQMHQTGDPKASIRLDGIWKYQPVAEFKDGAFYVYDKSKNEYLQRPKVLVSISPLTPTFLYNAMIAPLIPFAIKGAIWYQGESNTGEPLKYRTLFPLMIRNWRQDWGRGDFPFYYVQIAPFEYGATPSQELREAQMLSLRVPHTGMAVTLDIGNARNIHPGKKLEVGERLAAWALAKDYNKKVVCSGPVFKRTKVEGDRIRVYFDYAGTGLAAESGGLSGFEVAGADKVYHPAEAEIKGKQLLVRSNLVKAPVSVRYAWSNTAAATLFNKEGLPASSFRSEAW